MGKIEDISVNKNDTIKEAMKRIDQGALGIAFVLDKEKRFLGVVTDGDIRRAILNGIDLKKPVNLIANESSVTVEKGWDRGKIMNILEKKNIPRRIPPHGTIKIPVLDEKKRVIDIIFASKKECVSYLKQHPKNKIESVKKILVVGGAGYLGSILCRKLLDKNYQVRVLDNLTYGDLGIKDLYSHKKFEFIKGDMRDIQTVMKSVKDVDAVIHLAAIVGDPASALKPQETIEINYLGTKMLAEVCKYSQINRFIFASTCSVYGASPTPETKIDEESDLNPVSLYAEMKLKSEQALLEISDENFKPTILRMSTLYGLSPRMRFDLVVNILTIKALKEKKYTIFGGEQWRPNLHTKDAAEAYINCIESSIQISGGKIYNVGSDDENYKIIDIGKKIKQIIPDAEMEIDKGKDDERNYNVSFEKINKELDYKTNFTITEGVMEIKEEVENGKFDDYTDQIYSNYRFLKEYGE